MDYTPRILVGYYTAIIASAWQAYPYRNFDRSGPVRPTIIPKTYQVRVCKRLLAVFARRASTSCPPHTLLLTAQEVVARHGAAGVIQNFWQSRRNRAIARQLQRERRAQAAEAMRDQTSATAAQRQTSSALVPTDVLSAKPPPLSNPCTGASPTVLVAQNPTDQDQEREQERREVREGNDAFIYLLWGGFTSLITAEAARHAVRRAIATSLLALAAAALGDFNREQRNVGETTASSNTDRTSSSPSSSSYTSSSYSTLSTSSPSCSTRQSSSTSAPSGVNRAPGPVDTASLYHGTRHFEREMAVAGRRVAGVVRARGGSLSAVRSAIMRLVGDGVDSDGDGECLDDLGGWGVKAARMEAEHVVLEAVQVRLRPPPPPPWCQLIPTRPRGRTAVL